MLKYLLMLCLFLSCGCSHPRDKKLVFDPEKEIILKEDIKQLPPPEETEAFGKDEVGSVELSQIINKKLHYNDTNKVKIGDEIQFGDDTYWLPSKSWVFDIVYPHLATFLDTERIVYQNKFDCKDFSRTFIALAQLDYVHLMPDETMRGVAIGEVWYHPKYIKSGEGHSIIILVTDDKKIYFLEPQNGGELILTPEEIKIIYFIRF